MNKNSKQRLKIAQKNKHKGMVSSTFTRPAPYDSIVLTLAKTEPLDKFPKVARKRRGD